MGGGWWFISQISIPEARRKAVNLRIIYARRGWFVGASLSFIKWRTSAKLRGT